jgi:polyhydroxyalkanoate synthase
MSPKKAQRLDQLQEKGIPVTQWAILLVLMAYGAWKAYNAMNGKAKNSRKYGRGPVAKIKSTPKSKPQAKTKAAASASENKPTATKSAMSNNKDASTAAKKSKSIAFKVDNATSDAKVDTAAAKKKKSKPKNKPVSNGSKQDTFGGKPAVKTDPSTSDESSDEGWQTVGDGNGVAAADKKAKKPDNGSGSTKAVAPASISGNFESAAPAPSAAADDFVPAPATKKKTKKKKGKAETGGTTATTVAAETLGEPNTDADAALAARLQEAEDSLTATGAEDEWAEVTNKSKKREKPKVEEEKPAITPVDETEEDIS